MTIQSIDAYGPFLDTGINTAVTLRASTEDEVHVPGEIDTASKNTVAQTVASHGPHRTKNSPR